LFNSINSAPVLASVTLTAGNWRFGRNSTSEGPWVDVDKWLARMALQTEVKGGLTATLAHWPVWKEYLPEFRKAGGKLKTGGN